MAAKDWFGILTRLKVGMSALAGDSPRVMNSFRSLAQNATEPGELDAKTKELIALAIGITARCDGCLAYHAKAAADQGATRQEVIETIGVAVYMGGGPSMIYGAEALEAFDSLSV